MSLALENLKERAFWDTALAVLNGFPAEEIPGVEESFMSQIFAEILSMWILEQPEILATDARVVDALGRLEEMIVAYPDEIKWAKLLQRVQAIGSTP